MNMKRWDLHYSRDGKWSGGRGWCRCMRVRYLTEHSSETLDLLSFINVTDFSFGLRQSRKLSLRSDDGGVSSCQSASHHCPVTACVNEGRWKLQCCSHCCIYAKTGRNDSRTASKSHGNALWWSAMIVVLFYQFWISIEDRWNHAMLTSWRVLFGGDMKLSSEPEWKLLERNTSDAKFPPFTLELIKLGHFTLPSAHSSYIVDPPFSYQLCCFN